MIELLLDNEASLSSTRGTHALKFTKSISMTRVILNIDDRMINILDEDGMTPLHHIIEGSRGMKDDIIIYLLEKGAIVENGTDTIALAQKADCSFDVIDLLLELNPNYDVNTRYNNANDKHTTLLILYGKNLDIVERLLYLGADASLETDHSMNALFTALDGGDDQAVMKLLDSGANPLVYDKPGISCIIQICIRAEKDIQYQKWLDLIKYFILHCKSLDIIPSKPVSEMYVEVFLCLYIAYNSTNKERILKILQAFIETDDTFLSELMICVIPDTTSYIFKENSYENISYLLATISSRSEEFPNKMKEFIYILFDVGFSVCNTPDYCITALTTLLAFKNDGSELLGDIAQYCLVEEFIMRGVNVESVALQIREVKLEDDLQLLWNYHSTEISRYMLHLPDSVFLAFLNRRLNVLEILLPHWWGPPLALFTFTSSAKLEDVIYWFKFLFKYGPVPHGTQMFRKLKIYLEYFNSVDDEDKDQQIGIYYQQFMEAHSK
jgi:ankyrin repeat protein